MFGKKYTQPPSSKPTMPSCQIAFTWQKPRLTLDFMNCSSIMEVRPKNGKPSAMPLLG
jgi:hypothetical protein